MLFNPKIVRIIICLCTLFLYNAYAIPIDNNKNELKKRTEESDLRDHRIMYGIDLAILQLGVLCTLYTIIRSFVRWFKHNLSLHMSHKLPFYMALSDFFVLLVLVVNLYYPAVNNKLWPGQSCKIVALSFYYSAIFNMILVGSLALISYLRVCKGMNIDTGILDYKLFILPTLIPIILCVPAWQYFGDDGFWCYQTRESTLIPLVLLYMEIATLMTSIFCYIGIMHAINISRYRNDEEKFRTSNKKIISYLFTFIIQWTPVMIYVIIDMAGHQTNMRAFAVCILSLPIGVILNTYRYASHEGLWMTSDSDSELNGEDPSRRRTDLHSVKHYGGPPTVSQWRELSGEEITTEVDQTDQIQLQESQDQIQIQSQKSQDRQESVQLQESQDQTQIQSQDSQDQIQIQSQDSQDQIQIQSQDSQDQIQIDQSQIQK